MKKVFQPFRRTLKGFGGTISLHHWMGVLVALSCLLVGWWQISLLIIASCTPTSDLRGRRQVSRQATTTFNLSSTSHPSPRPRKEPTRTTYVEADLYSIMSVPGTEVNYQRLRSSCLYSVNRLRTQFFHCHHLLSRWDSFISSEMSFTYSVSVWNPWPLRKQLRISTNLPWSSHRNDSVNCSLLLSGFRLCGAEWKTWIFYTLQRCINWLTPFCVQGT